MAEEQEINIAIFKYLSGQADYSESILVREWISESNKNKQEFDLIRKHYEQYDLVLESTDVESKYDVFLSRINQAKQPDIILPHETPGKNHGIFWRYGIAAAIIAFITTTYVLFGDKLFNAPVQSDLAEEPQMSYSETRLGQKSHIRLPDGSEVWLNSGSGISFPKYFSSSIREVSMTGEGFFEVVHDAKRPFIVSTPNFKTEVLGTSFNIMAYKDEALHKVSLVSGKIKVHAMPTDDMGDSSKNTFILNPGYELKFNHVNGEIKEQDFNVFSVISWKEGTLVFEEDSFDQMAIKIERWYGIKVKKMGNAPSDFIVTGEYANENLTNLLESLRFGRNFKYELKHDHLIINFN
ncbi:MAG: FecR domain-containing protein [Cytophagales bacterium]|nr:FecR domain-containing protein [Cytophagales bacterium]